MIHFGALLAASLGLGFYLAHQRWPSPCALGDWFYPLALLVVFGAAESVGRVLGLRSHWAALNEGARIAWPAALIFALLAFVGHLPSVARGHLGALVVFVALLVLTFRVHQRSRRVGGIAVTPIPAPKGGLGLWELSLLGISLAIGAIYLRIGATAEGNLDNDSAYYFGVARHMARTGRFEEPLVWHFLNPPESITHAAFDYWGGLTSCVLAPILTIFGPVQRVAFAAMASISALSVIAFWYLVCFALPVRHGIIQLLALLSFAFSPFAHDYRFDTESLPLYHFLLTVALIAIAQGRTWLAVLAGFSLALCRIDGMALYFGICVAVLVQVHRRNDRSKLVRTLLFATGLVAVYVARNIWSFGSFVPSGSAAAPWLKNQLDLYSWRRDTVSIADAIRSRFEFDYARDRLLLLVQTVRALEFLPSQPLFLALGALPIMCTLRNGLGRHFILPGATVFAAYVLTWGSGPMFHFWRTLSGLLPLVVATCAVGASVAFDFIFALSQRMQRGRSSATQSAIALVTTAMAMLIVYPIADELVPYRQRSRTSGRLKERELRRLSKQFAGEPVMATSPWYVMANTRSPVVSIPMDGEEAIATVIRKYGVKWLVLIDKSPYPRASGSVLSAIQRGGKKTVGKHRIKRVDVHGTISVFRIE